MFDSECLWHQAVASNGLVQVGAWELRSLLETYERHRDALERIAAGQVHGSTWYAIAQAQRSHARRALDRKPANSSETPSKVPGVLPSQGVPLPSRHPHCGNGGSITTEGLSESPRYNQCGKPRNANVPGPVIEWWFLRDSNPGPSD